MVVSKGTTIFVSTGGSLKEINIDDDAPISVLIFGESGSGKTTLEGTFPNLYVIDTEDSYPALKDLKLRTGKAPLKVRKPESREDLFTCFDDLDKNAAKLGVESVGLDSLTDAQVMLQLQVMDEHEEVFKNKAAVADITDVRDWQRILIPEQRLMRRWKALGVNIVCVCQAKPQMDAIDRLVLRQMEAANRKDKKNPRPDEMAVPMKFRPFLAGAFSNLAPHYFDIVCYMRNINGTYVGHFRETGLFYAKTRYSLVPSRMENPTYEKLVAAIKGELYDEKEEARYDDWVKEVGEQQASTKSSEDW